MKTRKMLLSSLLALGILGTMSLNVANAAESATHDITGQLEKCRDVSYESGTDTNDIDCDGELSELSPTFRVTTNNPASQELRLSATAAGVTAMAQNGVSDMWIALAGPGALAANVPLALATPADVATNPNIIAYNTSLGFTRILPPAGGTVGITTTADYYQVDLQRQGETDFTLTAVGSPKPNTYAQYNDVTGDYVATLTFGFFGAP